MKKIIIMLFIVFLITPQLYATEDMPYMTKGHLNGRYWKDVDVTVRISLLGGIKEGV